MTSYQRVLKSRISRDGAAAVVAPVVRLVPLGFAAVILRGMSSQAPEAASAGPVVIALLNKC